MAKIPVSKAYAKWMAEDAERLNAMAELARKVAVTLPSKEEAEKRAFCPTGEGGGVKNDCSGSESSSEELVKAAVSRWKGFTSDIGIHVEDELSGKPAPTSGSGKKLREQAKALLREVIENSEPAPTLYRGDDKPPEKNTSSLLGWTSDKKVAEKWASKYGGQVYTLQGASGLNLSRFSRDGSGRDTFAESEWIVLHNKKSDSRAFCPTGEGGGVKNDCPPEGSADDSWMESSGERTWVGEDLAESSPIQNGKVLSAIWMNSQDGVANVLRDVGGSTTLSDIVTIAGGVRKNGTVDIYADEGGLEVLTSLPISPDGSSGDGFITIGTTVFNSEEGAVVGYDNFSVKHAVGKPGIVPRVSSLLLERMTESMSRAEKQGFAMADTEGTGDATDVVRGYRLWPQFGFDGKLSDAQLSLVVNKGDGLPDDVRKKAASGGLMVQELIATKQGEIWWDKFGSTIDLQFDFRRKDSLGYKRFERMKQKFARLRGRNSNRAAVHASRESRAFCPTGSGGGIDNSCSSVSVSDPSLKERVPFTSIGDGKNSDFIRVPTVDELTEALTGSNSSKGTKIGSAKDLPAGTPVALRIDIPAFNYSTKNMGKAIYAVTIHENKGGKGFGSPLAYEPMARLSGPVTFAAKEKEATKVATGEASKFPLATVKGNFDPSRTMPPDIDSWTPVGYDPKKAAYFYDKRTGREVIGGADALSVGNSVFVRVPKYGYRNAKTHYRSVAEMRSVGTWGIESRDDCGRQDGGQFAPGNKCQEEGSGNAATADKPSTPSSTKMPAGKVGDPESNTAWLSPSGVMHPVPRVKPPALRLKSPRGFTTHEEWASLHGQDGDSLMDSGWARVTTQGGTLYVNTKEGRPLTGSQRRTAKDHAIMAGHGSVVHDHTMNRPGRTIWSREDDRAIDEDGEERAFCPTGPDGGIDNSCSSSEAGAMLARVGDTKLDPDKFANAVVPNGPASLDPHDSLKLLTTPRRFELVGSIVKNMDPQDGKKSGKFAGDFVIECGYSTELSDELRDRISRSIEESDGKRVNATMEAAGVTAMLSAASREAKEVVGLPLRARNGDEIFDEMLRDGERQIDAMVASTAAAYYSVLDDNITVNTDAAMSFISAMAQNSTLTNKDFSTSQVGHAIVHEHGHMIHFRALRDSLGIETGKRVSKSDVSAINSDEKRRSREVAAEIGLKRWRDIEDRSISGGPAVEKIRKMSTYAMSQPSEFVAEYYAGLRLGVLKRDKDLDRIADIMGFPMDKMPPGRKGKKS